MTQVSKHPLSPKIEKKVFEIFINSVKNTRTSGEVVAFLNDLLSPTEKIMLAKRVVIAFLLRRGGYTYQQISKILRVSFGTIARVNAVLVLQGAGYRKIIGGLLKEEAIKQVIGELVESITPLPPKGVNWSEWYRKKRKRRLEKEIF